MIPASIDFCLDVSDVGLIDDQFDAYLDVSGLTIGDFLLALLHLLGEHHHDFGVHLSVNSNIITISQSLPSFLQKLHYHIGPGPWCCITPWGLYPYTGCPGCPKLVGAWYDPPLIGCPWPW